MGRARLATFFPPHTGVLLWICRINGNDLGRSEVLRSLRHSTCGHKAKDITPSVAWRREGAALSLQFLWFTFVHSGGWSLLSSWPKIMSTTTWLKESDEEPRLALKSICDDDLSVYGCVYPHQGCLFWCPALEANKEGFISLDNTNQSSGPLRFKHGNLVCV